MSHVNFLALDLCRPVPTNSLYCVCTFLYCVRSDNRTSLGVENFGLSVTTMEEVFIRVGQLAEKEKEEAEV